MSWRCPVRSDNFVPELKIIYHEQFINWGTIKISKKN